MEQKLLKIRATIYGRGSGILFDRMSENVLLSLWERFKLLLQNGIKKTRKKLKLPNGEELPKRDDMESKLYKNEKGEIGIPAENIFACLMEAGQKVKISGKNISTKKSSTVPGFLILYHDFFPFMRHSEVIVHKKMALHNNNKKELVWVWRPRIKEWAADIYFALDTNLCHPSVAEELFRVAGTIGIGCHRNRPDKDGRKYGKFMLAEFYIRGEWNGSNGEGDFFDKHPELLLSLTQQSC